MSEWISVDDKLPLEKCDKEAFRTANCLVTDGQYVSVCEFQGGNGGAQGGICCWVDWSYYGDIHPKSITHWMPLPEPPEDL